MDYSRRYIKKKDLELFIGRIEGFDKPKVFLEQYVSPPHLVSRLLWIAYLSYNDIYGRTIVDLGAGTGRLGLAAAYMGAREVYLIEIDFDAIRQAWRNTKKLGLECSVNPICADVSYKPIRKKMDVVLQNPPFGVHRRGMDLLFLMNALSYADVVYSIHKKEGISFIMDRLKSICRSVKLLFEEVIIIPKIYEFHWKDRHKVNVVAIRVL
ncbi:MAG: methyltransferase [Thermoproteales archaeon]|nr:methyltransferase [Thermoproteales archaeon]